MSEQEIRDEERLMALRWIRYRVLNGNYTSLNWVDGALLMEKEFENAMEDDFTSWKRIEKGIYGENK